MPPALQVPVIFWLVLCCGDTIGILERDLGITGPTAFLLHICLVILPPAIAYGTRRKDNPPFSDGSFWLLGGFYIVALSFIVYWIAGGNGTQHLLYCAVWYTPLAALFLHITDASGFFIPDDPANNSRNPADDTQEDRDNVKLETIYYYDERER